MQEKRIIEYLKALRLERWPRSFAIYLGTFSFFLLYPQKIVFSLSFFIKIILAFVFTWGISTANYIINEIADAPFDQHHPIKKTRPLAAGKVSKKVLMILFFLATIFSIAAAYLYFGKHYTIYLVSLLIAGFFYNIPPIRLKDIPILDFVSESVNNPIRFLIGWYAFSKSEFPPYLLLIWWWFFGMFLMIGKRIAEKRFLGEESSQAYRPSLKNVSEKVLFYFMVFTGFMSFALILLFSIEYKILTFTIFSFPFAIFLGWMTYTVNKKRGELEEPEELLKNPYLSIIIFILTFIFFISLYIETIAGK